METKEKTLIGYAIVYLLALVSVAYDSNDLDAHKGIDLASFPGQWMDYLIIGIQHAMTNPGSFSQYLILIIITSVVVTIIYILALRWRQNE